MHHVSLFLEINSYFTVLHINFNKAFDIVEREILLPNLVVTGLPLVGINWVKSYLTDRIQVCKIDILSSLLLAMNTSIIRGSEFGDSLYSIIEEVLHAISIINLFFKYADDTNLPVSENTDVCLLKKFDHIKE